MTSATPDLQRVLIVDDEQAIRQEYLRVLCPSVPSERSERELAGLRAELLGGCPEQTTERFDVVQCRQGGEAIEAVMVARADDRPFSVAFLDVRMPPGPSGVNAAAAIREHDPDIYIVIVTGYSDDDPRQIARMIPPADKLFYLLKPLHARELKQLAKALNEKWKVDQSLKRQQQELERKVAERTASLLRANAALEKEIAERKRVEEALRKSTKSAQLLQKIAVAANQASVVDEAIQACLDEVCAYTGWPVGHAYRLPENGAAELVPTRLWHLDDADQFETFRRVTEATQFESGNGLPGRVWRSATPVWIVDVTKDQNFPRAKLAGNLGVKAAFAFPVLIGKEVAAVLEFFSGEAIEPDEHILDVIAQVGTQIGRAVERKRAEQATRESRELLHAVIDAVPAMINTKDRDLRYVLMNRFQAEFYGKDPEQTVGKTATDLAGLEYGRYMESFDRKVIETGEPLPYFEETSLDGSDNPHTLFTTKVPLKDADGRVKNVVTVALDISERKQMEDALRASEGQFRDLIEGSIQGVLIHRYFKPLFVNQSLADIFGYDSPEDILRLDSVWPLIATEEHPRLAGFANARMKGEDVPANYEYQGLRKDGSRIWLQNSGRAVAWGGERAIQSVIVDITERKAISEELARSEDHLKQAARLAKLGHWVWDAAEERYVHCSEEHAAIHGLPLKEYLARGSTIEGDLSFTHPEDRGLYQAALRDLRKGKGCDIEYRVVTPDGEIRYVREIARPIFDENGTVVQEFGTIQDITETKRVEKALQESEERFQSFAEIGSDWLWEMDADLRFSYLSDPIHKITGLPREHYLGKTRLQVGQGSIDDEKWRQHLADLEVHRPFRDFCYTSVKPDGRRHDWSISGEPIFDSSGKFAGYRGVGSDITERRRAEEALRTSEEKFFAALNNSSEAIALYDADDRLVLWNDVYRRHHSGQLESLLEPGLRFEDLVRARACSGESPTAIGREEDYVTARLERHRCPGEPFETQRKGGWYRYREHRTPDGGTMIVISDITDLKRRETELTEKTTLLRSILDAVPVTIGYRDTENRYVFVNQRAANRLNKRPDEVIGKTFGEIWGETDNLTVQDLAQRVIESGEPIIDAEIESTCVPGHTVMVSLVPVIGSAGRVAGVVTAGLDITDRKQAEKALQESQARLVHATTMAKLGYWAWDEIEDKASYCSDELAHILGYSTGEEMLSLLSSTTAHSQWIHPDDRERYNEATSAASLTKNGFDIEYKVLRHDGAVRHVREIGMGEFDEQGRLVHSKGTIQDITAEKEAGEVLREREALLVHAQQVAKVGYWVWYDEKISDWAVTGGRSDRRPLLSDQFREIFGISDSQACHATRQAHPDDRARCLEALRKADECHEAYNLEYRTVDDDGKIRFVHEIGEPRLNAETGQRIWLGVVQDTTERKQVEKALRESQAELIKAQEIAKVGSWTWHLDDGGMISVSDEYLRIIGFPADRPPKNQAEFNRYIHADDLERTVKIFDEAVNTPSDYEVEYRFVRPDGEVRHIVELGELIHDDRGRAVGHAGTIQDITELKRAEEQLLHAQKMELVGQLTGGVAHDFNNLLAIILGNLELAGETLEDGSELRCLLDPALRATKRGAELTQRLLAFARKQTLRPESIDLSELVLGMGDLLQRTLGETIEVSISNADELWMCHVDPGQLENALLNLAINARDAMPEGGRLTMETANVESDDGATTNQAKSGTRDYVLLAVSDTGTGMSLETLERAFDPFFTTKEVGQGSGLGLSMVYGFARQSGGRVTIDSSEGQGTTVKLYLPKERHASRRAVGGTTNEEPRASGETVLVVEDEPDVRDFIVRFLSGLGYGVVTAEDGKGAVAVLTEHPRVDLLLTDMVLPGRLTGVEISKQARRRSPNTKILFMTGYAHDAELHQALLDDGVVILRKPFRKHELAQKVRDALDGRGA